MRSRADACRSMTRPSARRRPPSIAMPPRGLLAPDVRDTARPSTPSPAARSAWATFAPSLSGPAPTADQSALSAPCSATGRTAPSGPQATNAPPPLTAGPMDLQRSPPLRLTQPQHAHRSPQRLLCQVCSTDAMSRQPRDSGMVGELAAPDHPENRLRPSRGWLYSGPCGEREGCRDVVVGGIDSGCGWHPDFVHDSCRRRIRLSCATVERPDAHAERRVHRLLAAASVGTRGIRVTPAAAPSAYSQVVMGAGPGDVGASLWISSRG